MKNNIFVYVGEIGLLAIVVGHRGGCLAWVKDRHSSSVFRH